MIAALFPPEVITREAADGAPAGGLLPEEAAVTGRMAPRRLRDFTAGRVVARQALAALGVVEFPLLPDADRVPRWPAGVVGSLSHCDGFCGVAVAPVRVSSGLGLDIETAAPLESDLVALVTAPSEREWMRHCQAPDGTDWGKILFSAKEAVYKAWFPRGRRMLEFQEVTLEPGPMPYSLRALLPSAKVAEAGFPWEVLPVRFRVTPRYVAAGVALPP